MIHDLRTAVYPSRAANDVYLGWVKEEGVLPLGAR
jgi:hypothetical protein